MVGMIDFVKKVEGIKKKGYAKVVEKNTCREGSFSGSYSRGLSIYECGGVIHIKSFFPNLRNYD